MEAILCKAFCGYSDVKCTLSDQLVASIRKTAWSEDLFLNLLILQYESFMSAVGSILTVAVEGCEALALEFSAESRVSCVQLNKAVVDVVILLVAPVCRGHHSEQARMKDLAIVLCRLPFPTHPGLKPAALVLITRPWH